MELLANAHGYNLYKLNLKSKISLRLASEKTNKSADHIQYQIINDKGDITYKSINDEDIPIIINSFKRNGPTKAFVISKVALNEINPEGVLHQKTLKEASFTSTGEKLDYHWPIFEKLKDTGYASIVRATLTLHQVCSSRCSFCSTINRNTDDSISLEEAKNFIDDLHDKQIQFNRKNFSKYNEQYKDITGNEIGLGGVILSGGGQPNLWKDFPELVKYIHNKGIKLGLITNGFPKNINDEIYDLFQWVRLSITPPEASPHYKDGKFENQYIPSNLLKKSRIPTLGLSYVHGPWSANDDLNRLDYFSRLHEINYVRALVDCNLDRNAQLKAHNNLSGELFKKGLIDERGGPKGKIFHQLKYHMKPSEAEEIWPTGKCWLQSYNVFWDTTGHDQNGKSFCYPCDSVTVLSEEGVSYAARGFDGNKWGTVTNNNVQELYKKPLHSYFDPRNNCRACLFHKNNRQVQSIMKNIDSSISKTKSANIKRPNHLMFP